MSVIRVEKTKDYTIMSNEHFKEKEMSLKAKGLLSLMLSLPDEWDYSIAGLVAICKESDTAIKSTLDELKEFGYLEMVKKTPDQTNSGRFEYEYIVYETSIKQKQEGEKQGVEILGLEIQGLENHGQLNIKQLNNKQLNTKNNEYIDEKNLTGAIILTKEEKEEMIFKQSMKYIIEYLNETAGTHYRVDSKTSERYIKARFNEGFKIDDFYDVVDKKYKQWKGTEFEKYIRPETLFGTKFENYLNEKNYFSGKPKTTYSSKPNFDNTANHNIPKALSTMNKEEKQKFYDNDLAKDENGNFLKF